MTDSLPATPGAVPAVSPARRHLKIIDVQTIVFGALALVTVLSWLLGTEEADGHETPVGIAVISIAFLKLRAVGLYFMELRHAPRLLRALFEGYSLVVFTVMLILFLVV